MTVFQVQQLLQRAPVLKVGPPCATDMLDQILTLLGERGKNSLLSEHLLFRVLHSIAESGSVRHIMGKNCCINNSDVH